MSRQFNIILILCVYEVPEQVVLSPASGYIYKRRLIEKYIAENGKDPMNGKRLSVDMLINVKSRFIYIYIYIYVYAVCTVTCVPSE